MIFRTATPDEAVLITQLTLDSKRYWGYSEEQMKNWIDELTISPEYIERNMVFVAEISTYLVGYVSIIEEGPEHILDVGNYKISGGFFLDNLFIHPSHIRQGIGEKLLNIALNWCKEKEIKNLHVVSDPNAKDFYEKMGAICLGNLPSSIAGRYLPLMVFHIEP